MSPIPGLGQFLGWLTHLQVPTIFITLLTGSATALTFIVRLFSDRRVLSYHFTEVTDKDAYTPQAQAVLNQYNDDTPQRRHYARVWELSLKNAGNQPIKRDDFDANQPIGVEIQGATIACITVNHRDNRTDPDNLPVVFDPPELDCATIERVDPDAPPPANEPVRKCAVRPILLNPRDRISLQFVLLPTTYPITAHVTARIVGIRRPTLGLSDRAQLLENGTEATLTVMAILIGLIYAAEQHTGAHWPIVGPYLAAAEAFITQFNVLAIASVIALVVLVFGAGELLWTYQRQWLARFFRRLRRSI